MKKRLIETLLFAILLALPQTVFAAPALMNYQGVLTNLSGQAVTDSVTMNFEIWDDETNGSSIWSELHSEVTLQNGVYSVILGSVNTETLTSDLFADDVRWLEVTVNGEILSPRQRITSVAYAHNADLLDGKDSSVLQRKISGTCVSGSSISSINSDGTVTCETGPSYDDRLVVQTITSTPSYTDTPVPFTELSINGTIRARELIITTEGWADYVFKDSYTLKPLDVVEKEINRLGHLPNMPSEKEVLEKGLNIAEMQTRLLEKIEELTLYVIQQDKAIKILESRNDEL